MAKTKTKTEEVEAAKPEPTTAAPKIELVKMVRDQAPFTADVHPAEVENYKKGGWRVAE